jgi:hypothetical protein
MQVPLSELTVSRNKYMYGSCCVSFYFLFMLSLMEKVSLLCYKQAWCLLIQANFVHIYEEFEVSEGQSKL